MHVLSVKLSDEEHNALKMFAEANNVSMSKAIKNAFFEKIEDEYDVKTFDKAYAEYLKDPAVYTLDEVNKHLGH